MASKTPKEKPEEKKEEVVEETPVEETRETTEDVVDTPAVEETPEPEAKTEEVEEEEFDLEEFKKSTIEETKKAVAKDIAESLGLSKEEEEQSKDEGLIPPWEKRGETKPKSWKENNEYTVDLVNWKRKQEEERVAKAQDEQEEEAKEINKKWQDYWDTELDELEKTNKIPAVKNPDDPNDAGKKARVKLFSKMHELGLERQAKGLAPINSVKLIFYEHYESDEPAGADAPISFGKSGAPTSGGDDYTYEEIHGSSFDKLKDN